MSESNEDKVRRYTENLKSGDDPKRALKRLFELQVPSQTFQEFGTRKAAKRYRDHEECKKYAKRLCKRLLEMEIKRTRSVDSESIVHWTTRHRQAIKKATTRGHYTFRQAMLSSSSGGINSQTASTSTPSSSRVRNAPTTRGALETRPLRNIARPSHHVRRMSRR